MILRLPPTTATLIGGTPPGGNSTVADGAAAKEPRLRYRLTAALLCLVGASACGEDSPTRRSSGALVTFAVADETFRVSLTTRERVAAAHAAQSGGGARIPNGRIVPGTQVNTGWSWHL